jgi:SPP1 family phage portal protein
MEEGDKVYQITEDLILQCLEELKKNQSKYNVWKRYYENDMDIMYHYKMQNARSNMRVVVGYPQMFINREISYSLGKALNYVPKKDDAKISVELIDDYITPWEKLHNQNLLKQALIFGEAYSISYINNGEYRETVATPMDMYVLESSDANKDVLLGVYKYTKKFIKDKEFCDVYTADEIIQYEIDSDKLIELNRIPHYFGEVPISVACANDERESNIKPIKSLVDSVNETISNLTNESSDMRNAILSITAADLQDSDIDAIAEKGIVKVPIGGSCDWLIKKLDSSFVKHLLETTEEKIYELSSHINTALEIPANTSGTALRSRLIALENKCSLHQAQMEKVIRKRLRLFFTYMKKLTGKEYGQSISIVFSANVPQDINLISDSISKLRGLVSDSTLLTLLPFIESPEIEMAKRRKEQAEEESIDLDKLKIGDDDVEE